MDFKDIVNSIFINRSRYSKISDEDKEKNFFIINRKFSRNYPKVAQFFNNKSINKCDAVDRWFMLFENERRIPQWYWGNRNKKQKSNNLSNNQILLMMEKLELPENDVLFLNKYYKEDLDKEIKRYKN